MENITTEPAELTELREQIEKDNQAFEMKINCFRTIRNNLDERYEKISDELYDEENTFTDECKRTARMLLNCYNEVDSFISKEIKELKTFIK